MNIIPETSMAEIVALLAACSLPVEDIAPALPLQFFGHRENGVLVAVIGLEMYPPAALLRSLAVAPAWRGRGLGQELVAYVESFAAVHALEMLFLLTTTAAPFFMRLGYTSANRHTAPATIQATSQFSDLCPASAAFLSRQVAKQANYRHEEQPSAILLL